MGSAYLTEVYNNVSKEIVEGCDFACMIVEMAASDIIEAGEWMGRKVETWTDEALPKPLAAVVQKAFNSLPFFLASQLLPFYITAPALIGLSIISLIGKNPFSDQTNCNLNYGVAFSRAYRTVENVTLFVLSRDFRYLASAVITGIAGALFYIKGQQYEGANPL